MKIEEAPIRVLDNSIFSSVHVEKTSLILLDEVSRIKIYFACRSLTHLDGNFDDRRELLVIVEETVGDCTKPDHSHLP